MSSKQGHQSGSGNSDKSLNEVLDEIVDTYGGGKGYEQWSVKLVSQSERGLLIELARLRALGLQLRQKQIAQQGRVSAIVSTMLALEAGGSL